MNIPGPRRLVTAFGFGFFALGVFSGAFVSRSVAAGKSEYRGFTIDDSGVQKMSNLEAVRAAIREQIDISCAVGLPEDFMKFFRGVRFEIVPAESIPGTTPGLYSARKKKVEVTSRIVTTGHKPVLLHELLHAYHDQRIPGGYGNREILALYARAQHLDVFARKSHMMENEKEFFACAGTTYLFGVTAQEPFQREKVKDRQPELFQYLKTLFGPDAGNYAGSLTR